MKALDLEPYLLDDGKVQSYAWPGGYPLYFVCEDDGVLCPNCVSENRSLINRAAIRQCELSCDDTQWRVVATDVNYEDTSLYCDNCRKRIESAYAEDSAD